jgi:hypothetical protein
MPYAPGVKKTLLVPSGPLTNPFRNHLFVTVTDRSGNHQHLLVPICSVKPGRYFDNTCEIKPGEHGFLSTDSYVEYRLSQVRHANNLTTLVDTLYFKPHDDVTDQLLQRIYGGILQSRHTPTWVKTHVRRWPLV